MEYVFMDRTLLVTGGAGFIGGAFVRRMLRRDNYRIVTLDKLTYAGCRNSIPADSDRHTFVHGDIGDTELIGDLLRRFQPCGIVHFAAESHVDRSIANPRDFVKTNVLKTCDLLFTTLTWWKELPASQQSGFRFLHVSTDEVFGSADPDVQFDEGSPYRPNSPYAASKTAADVFVRAMFQTYDLPVLTTHCSNNYGPYQFPEKLIPLIILSAIEGRPLPIYGDGMNVRDWLYVEDHCGALELVLQKGRLGETYNIGANYECSNREVVSAICQQLDAIQPSNSGNSYCEQIQFVEDRPGHDRRYALDVSKIRTELGWCPHQSFDNGLETTIRWYLSNPKWVEEARNKMQSFKMLSQAKGHREGFS